MFVHVKKQLDKKPASFFMFFVLVTLLIMSTRLHATTQTRLLQLTQKMTHLKASLTQDENQQSTLHQQLIDTQKKIDAQRADRALVHQTLDSKQADIVALQQLIDKQHTMLQHFQQQLAHILRVRYKMRQSNAWGPWHKPSDSPMHTQRLMRYYQSIIRAQEKIIQNIQQTQRDLQQKKQQLDEDIKKQQERQQQAQQQEEQWLALLAKQKQLLHDLQQQIHHQHQQLSDYEKNHQHLIHLVSSLTQKSVIQTRHPFTQMRKNLPYPVDARPIHSRKFTRGILFDIPEGTPIHAIYPGKIVFSDWLNGYGFLIIIDHGWGFMSIYGHNKSLLKQIGQTVAQHEVIALSGHSGSLKKDGLYFEIRHHGKAMTPYDWFISP